MWRDYSWSYIRHNRASGLSVIVSAFISALFLSLLCSLFYNLWKYDVEKIRLEGGDWQPTPVFPFFFAVTFFACVSLIMIIYNSFSVSMNARIHQFGILSSIGATPRQIRTCLLQEAMALCAAPVAAGNLLGILAGRGILWFTNLIAGDVPGRHEAVWGYHPLVLALTIAITALTIWISAWIPSVKLSRRTPLEAIKNTGELQLEKKKESRILAVIFGVEGELAGNAMKAQRKALRTASLSLVCSFFAFTLMQCFFTLSDINTRMTYFERYQDVWDIMAEVKGSGLDSFDGLEELRQEVQSAVAYQKGMAKRVVEKEELDGSPVVSQNLQNASGAYVTALSDAWLVNAPVIVLDDRSFLAYCRQIGADLRLDGAIILNRIRDAANPDFRHPVFSPYIKESGNSSILRSSENEAVEVEVPVTAYTQEPPALREEYASVDYYELVHFLPVSLWKEIKGQIGGMEEDFYIQILAGEDVSLKELNALQEKVEQMYGQSYEIVCENRMQEKLDNDRMIRGMKLIFGGFCVLLALIGIGNVFSNTLGFVRQRKREFARYLSVGLTPGGMKKMFRVEALVLAGGPVLLTLPLTAAAVGLMLKASYLSPAIFIREAPVLPVLAFALSMFGFVALAYYLGWRQMNRISLIDALRDDTLY